MTTSRLSQVFFLLFLLTIIWLEAFPAMAIFEIGGYYENDVVGLIKKDNGILFGDVNRLRFKTDLKPNPNLLIHLEPRYYFLIKTQSFPLVGVTSLDQLIWDRVYFKIYSPVGNLTAGKQRIAWGTGYIWNPTDIFNPYVLSFAVKEEEEANVEAVRLEIPAGVAGGIDSYVLMNNAWENTKKGIKIKTNIGLFDFSLSYVDLGKANGYQFGFDSVGEIFGMGVRSEIALKAPINSNSYIQWVLGWDYTLENGISLNMEYFYNGLGKGDKNDYDWATFFVGDIKQLGVDYLFLGMNKIINEITSVKVSLITNLDDQSWIFYPQYTRNLSQNFDLSLEAMLAGGPEGSEYYPSVAQDPSSFGGSKTVLLRGVFSF